MSYKYFSQYIRSIVYFNIIGYSFFYCSCFIFFFFSQRYIKKLFCQVLYDKMDCLLNYLFKSCTELG